MGKTQEGIATRRGGSAGGAVRPCRCHGAEWTWLCREPQSRDQRKGQTNQAWKAALCKSPQVASRTIGGTLFRELDSGIAGMRASKSHKTVAACSLSYLENKACAPVGTGKNTRKGVVGEVRR